MKLNRLYSIIYMQNLRLKGIDVGANSTISHRSSIATKGGGSIRIGSRCKIHDYAILWTYGGTITIGDNCSVNPFCVLYGHGNLTIGNGVRIAAHTVIIPANHNFSDLELPIREQGETRLGIVIEDDVWIGAGARILDGVTIRNGSVIGAGAVVTKDTEPACIYGGVPARKIGNRRSVTATDHRIAAEPQ